MCVKRTFFSLESLIFYLEHQQTIFLGLFRPKTKKDQILIFQLTPWINPFEKSLVYGICVQWTFFSLENLSFHLEHQQTIFLGLF